jgi:hypothetical protein
MAASTPALRVLSHNPKVLSNRRDYATMASCGITGGSRFEHSQNQKVTISAGGLHELHDGNGSKDIILQDVSGKIVQQTDINVEYDAVSSRRRVSTDKESISESGNNSHHQV